MNKKLISLIAGAAIVAAATGCSGTATSSVAGTSSAAGTSAGISATVVDSDSACISVAECCAGECNVLNVAYALIILSGVGKVLSATILNLPGLVDVKDSS